jgi:hypothetical protein
MLACPLSTPLVMPSHRAVIAGGPGTVTSTVIVSLSPRVTVNSCGRPVAGTVRVWPFTVIVYDSPGGGGAGLLTTGWLVPPSVSGTAAATTAAETAVMIPARLRRLRLIRRTRAARSPVARRGGPASAADAASRERSSGSSIGIAVLPPAICCPRRTAARPSGTSPR